MSGLDFGQFFKDVHGFNPLPWQARLAEQLVTTHQWPDLIDLPTASGKTACVDIALFHLAWCAEKREAWRAARRIVFVVDRRIIVDAVADRADRLRAALKERATESVTAVAKALSRLGGTEPLMCFKLRGGMRRERGFAFDPAQPMIVTSTVDQVGSRLLFRGYGLSQYARPIHAGLLAYDALFLVDEAHLSAPFIDTVAAVNREQGRAQEAIGSVRPVLVVPMSATAKTDGERFQLDAADLENPEIAQRRTTPKPTRLIDAASKPSERVKVLLREVLSVYQGLDAPAPAVALIVNRVRTARAMYEMLLAEAAKKQFDVQLLIGRSRPLDRDTVAARVVSRVGAGCGQDARARGLIVVATQTIEVGADLDFHGLVTECAAIDALRQRFGRLDRLGRFRRSQAVIVGDAESADDPVYGRALSATWGWLKTVAASVDGKATVDFSIEAMEKHIQSVDIESLVAKSKPQLTLTPSHVSLLSQTSPAPMYEPEIAALLHGLDSGPPDVQIIWRSDLPIVESDSGWVLDYNERTVAKRLVDLNPPTSLECLALPLKSVRAWLEGGDDEQALSDVEGTSADEVEETAGRRRERRILQRTREGWEPVLASRIRPGDSIIVTSVYGGCDEFGFAPDSQSLVTDLSARARRALDRSTLQTITPRWLTEIGFEASFIERLWKELEDEIRSETKPREILITVLERIGDLLPSELGWMRDTSVVELISRMNGHLYAIVVTEARVRPGDISDEDMSSSRTVPVLLRDHNAGVGKKARYLGEVLSLSIERTTDLWRAGGLHDIGKADPRFQRQLSEVLPELALAKGKRRSQADQGVIGERHEAYSVAFLKRHADLLAESADPELILYLIGTHHGRGRSLMPDCDDEGTGFTVEVEGVERSFDGVPALGSLQSEWPTLFWTLNRRYGPWGIAYLESILRLADWLRSAEELRSGGES